MSNSFRTARCYLTMLQLTLWPLSATMQATWLSIPTRMQPSYLVLPNAQSRYAGHYILSDTPPPPPEIPNPKPNGAILTVCKTIHNVMTSAAEAETAGVFGNGQEIIAIRILLQALGHPQLATPLKTDNSTSNSFVHANIKQRCSKTWDM